MDSLQEAATAYTALLNIDYFYTLENSAVIQVYFIPAYFHHLLGLHKLTDIPRVKKGQQNNPGYIFKKIAKGAITLDDIQKKQILQRNRIKDQTNHYRI